MNKYRYILLVFALLLLLSFGVGVFLRKVTPERELAKTDFDMKKGFIELPEAQKKGRVSLEEVLHSRRSIRIYHDRALSLAEVSQLLWSAQGITGEQDFRTSPSAGATFPLELFVIANRVEGLPVGIYQYHPLDKHLSIVHQKDVARDIMYVSHRQSVVVDAPLVIVFGAIVARTEERYAERAERYVFNEVGHASQNVYLQATAMGLGTVVVGAFDDEEVEKILNLDSNIRVMYMMPVGALP